MEIPQVKTSQQKVEWLKVVVLATFAVYFIWCFVSFEKWHFLDNVNLIIHEAGHFIFAIFDNEFIGVLGGTIFQLAVPIVFIVYFFLKGQFFSGSLLMFWLAQSLLNVAVYLGDAVKMELPLLGGGDFHDWNYLLGRLNILANADKIALLIRIFSVVIALGAIIIALLIILKPKNL
ncbi:MAG: hypothetical protein V1819_03045, partial [bacterium]